MLSPARLLPAAGCALLCVVLALGYASAQTPPVAPTIDSVTSGDTTLTVAWTAPAGETGITAYDVRHIKTSENETDDANWTVVGQRLDIRRAAIHHHHAGPTGHGVRRAGTGGKLPRRRDLVSN